MPEVYELYRFLVARYDIERIINIGLFDHPQKEFWQLYGNQIIGRYSESASPRSSFSTELDEDVLSRIVEQFRKFVSQSEIEVLVTAPLINFCFDDRLPHTVNFKDDLRIRPLEWDDLVDIGGVRYPGFLADGKSGLPADLFVPRGAMSFLAPWDLCELRESGHVLELRQREPCRTVASLGREKDEIRLILGLMRLVSPDGGVGIRIISKRAADSASFLRFPYSGESTSRQAHII